MVFNTAVRDILTCLGEGFTTQVVSYPIGVSTAGTASRRVCVPQSVSVTDVLNSST